MVLSMDPKKTIVRKQINAIQFGSVLFTFLLCRCSFACLKWCATWKQFVLTFLFCLCMPFPFFGSIFLLSIIVDSIRLLSPASAKQQTQQFLYRWGHPISQRGRNHFPHGRRSPRKSFAKRCLRPPHGASERQFPAVRDLLTELYELPGALWTHRIMRSPVPPPPVFPAGGSPAHEVLPAPFSTLARYPLQTGSQTCTRVGTGYAGACRRQG